MFRRIWTHGIDAPIANTFKFQVVYAAPGTFTLPINTGGAGYVHNFTVNWGDGTPDSTVTSFDDPDRIHTYAGAGTYNITMTGVCEWFAFNNAGDKDKITKLLAFMGDMRFKRLNFQGCLNLNTIIPLGIKNALTLATSMFANCTSITVIPSGLFDGCPNITSFSMAFFGDTGITSIPGNLFKYNILATAFPAAFYGNTSLTSIPEDIFRYNPLVTTFGSTFWGNTSLTSIPEDIFRYNPLVTLFGSTFWGNTSLTSIPEDIFRYNPLVTTFGGTFLGDTGIIEIPDNLFKYNPKVTHFGSTFWGNTSLTSIPEDIFRYNPLVTIMSATFRGCLNITAIPIHIFDYNTLLTTVASVFYGCIGLVCSLDGNIFLNCLVLVNFEEAFQGCANMTGLGQPIIDNTALPGHSVPTATAGCFNGCIGLTDYATIPAGWK